MLEDMHPMDVPTLVTTTQMVEVISALQTCAHVLAYWKLAMRVLLVALWHRRFATRQHISATGQPMGRPVQPCRIYLLLMPFFGIVESRLTKSARARASGGGVATLYEHLPTKNWISLSWKGCFFLSDPPFQYSNGRRRKKNVIQVRPNMA